MASIRKELEQFTDEFEGELEKHRIMGIPITRNVSLPLMCCCGIIVLVVSITIGSLIGKHEDNIDHQGAGNNKQYSDDERYQGFLELLEPLVGSSISESGTGENAALVWLAHNDPMELPLDTHLDYITQRFVLANIYESTNGHNSWRSSAQKMEFCSYRPECEWNILRDDPHSDNGAWCRTNSGKITWLELDKVGLDGTIPSSIGLLTELTYLSMNSNNLIGTLPGSVQLLQQCTHLSFHTNQLTGHYPKQIHDMHKLEKLRLHNNLFGGELSMWEMLTMKKIKYIDFSNNNFDGKVAFDKMKDMTSLEYFDVSHNNLGNTISKGIGEMPNLKTLILGNNSITGNIPKQIQNAESLEYIDLSQNQLTGTLPTDWPIDLQALIVWGNNLDRNIPSSIFQIKTLNHLNLDSNGFDGKIPSTVAEATNIHTLQLGRNQLTGKIPTEIGMMYELQTLDLSHNLLTGIVPTELGLLGNIESLHLNNNKLDGELPPTLGDGLPELIEFIISHNKLFGTLSAMCDRPASFQKLEIFEADCQRVDVLCSCCTSCCDDDGVCCNTQTGLCTNA